MVLNVFQELYNLNQVNNNASNLFNYNNNIINIQFLNKVNKNKFPTNYVHLFNKYNVSLNHKYNVNLFHKYNNSLFTIISCLIHHIIIFKINPNNKIKMNY